jgi:translocation and assembly module TamB
MNRPDHQPDDEIKNPHEERPLMPVPKRRRIGGILAWSAGSFVALILLLIAGAAFYTTTTDFQHRVGGEVVKVLEDSTGGRVELRHLSFDLWHLAIEADGLVIHGTEAVGQAPYLSAEKILLRVTIHTFLSHTVGKGPQSHVSLSYLRIEEPHFHLIIDKDGKTNQPVPRHPSTSNEPIQDTLLDLQIGKLELANGLAVVNDRAVPFDLAARDLGVDILYIPKADHYGITVDLNDLRTRMASRDEVQSKIRLTAELGRDMAELKSFDFTTGASTHLSANALVQHFAKPEWQASAAGSIDLKQLGLLADVDGLTAGSVELDVHGRNCVVTPQAAQKNPHFWQRHNKAPVPPGAKMLPPDPDCKSGYLLVGAMKMHNAGFRNEFVRLHDINGGAQLHVTPTQLLFTALTGYLPGGGSAEGDLRIENWLGEVPTGDASATTIAAATTANTSARSLGAAAPVKSLKSKPVARAHAYLTVTINHIPLRTIMAITAPEHYGDLGFDTSITGPAKIEWGGPETDIADTVQVDGDLEFAPTNVVLRGARSNIPVTGHVKAHYDGLHEVVNIAQLNLQTPQSGLQGSGVLGVNNGDPLTALQVNMQVRDLGEYDQLLQTLGFEANGKKGSAAIPVVLHGTMDFVGTARGAVRDLDVKGHLVADNVEAKLGTAADFQIDSVVGDAEYSPYSGIAVASSTIKRGTAVLNITGTFAPRKVVSRRGVVSYEWDEGMAINTGVKLANAQVPDLLQIAGEQSKVPLTGVVNINMHAAGTLTNLNGSGNITLTNGVAYGEGYQTVSVDVTAQGRQIDATKLLVAAHGMSVTGSGGYNLDTKHIDAQLQGNNLVLSKLDTVKKADVNADGTLSFTAAAHGTMQEPNLNAKLTLANVVADGKPLGELSATATSTGSNVLYDLHSTLVGAQVTATGQTSLLGDYDTQAKLTIAGLDIAKPLDLFSSGSVKASSSIGATITITGPAAKPAMLTGTAEFSDFDVKLQGVELKSAEPLRASLRGGVVTIDQLHITGQDTDLHAGGTIAVFGDNNAQGGKIGLNASGSVSMTLAHTFDPDLTTSGKVTFKVAADGRLMQPSLTGNVKFENVNVAVDGIPNGLSNLNGTMVFDENRLTVQSVTAMTGGGQLKLGGSISYQKGIFADLTATGENVRVRLYGLSATANASFQLQGGPQAVRLSGNVLVTRFGVGQDVDFAAFAGTGGVQAPPDPNAASNKIQLDIHVTSSPQLDFQNSYAKLAGNVDLTIRGTVAVPSVLGRIQITDGSATFAGTKYELERGNVYFSNPVRIDPTIDLDATARVENYDITIGLHGTTTNLKPTYRSEPPLSEADIFNLLALGRTQEEAQLYQEQQVQAGTDPTTSALLGGALNATVSSRVGKLFGAGSVKIDPAFVGTLGNSSARITVQEPLSKQLTLTFATNVNQTAQQLIQLQYQINQDTALVATRDESGVFSIVYKIRKRYK